MLHLAVMLSLPAPSQLLRNSECIGLLVEFRPVGAVGESLVAGSGSRLKQCNVLTTMPSGVLLW